jgi:catechol 2,3-dioxygenase-like lactoylglutathione lyase family enzyme
MIRIATTQLWVHDQDEALRFYTQQVGMEVRQDVTLPEMHFRWLTVAPVGQDVDIVLMAIPPAPIMDAATARASRAPCS